MLPRTPSPWSCLPALALHLCFLWGVLLWGAQRPLHAPSPQISLPKSPPWSLPAPGCAEKIQQRRMWPRSRGLLCPNLCTHEQPPKPEHCHRALAQSPSLQEVARVPLPWPFHHPSVCPYIARGCCPAFASCPVSLCPGDTFLGRSRSCPHQGGLAQLLQMCAGFARPRGSLDPPNSAFLLCSAAVNPSVLSAAPSTHTCLQLHQWADLWGQFPSSSWAGLGALTSQGVPGCDPWAFINTGEDESCPGNVL